MCSFSRVIEVVVWAKINHPRKRACMLVFKGNRGGDVGNKEFDMTWRVLPLLAMLEMVSGAMRRDGTLLIMSLCLQMLCSKLVQYT